MLRFLLVRTVCVPSRLAVSLKFIYFAPIMQTRRRFSFLLLAVSTCLSVLAQEAIYVHGRQGCQVFDIRNIAEMRLQHDMLSANVGALCLEVPFDSISFADTPQSSMRVGWWGDKADGSSCCYYWPDSTNVPNVKMEADGGLCTFVREFVRQTSRQMPRRVGRKWRYTTGTLTGRHRMHLSCFDASCFEHYTMRQRDADADTDHMEIDMSQMFMGRTSSTVGNALDYWHRPKATTAMPAEPVFGRFDGHHYELPLVDDSLTVCVDLLQDNDGMVVCDSMYLDFASEHTAREAYEQMEIEGDSTISTFFYGNGICIVEQFQATIDEVRQWLVRFDLDLYKPLFLREEE